MNDQYRSALAHLSGHPMLRLALLYHRVPHPPDPAWAGPTAGETGAPLSFRDMPFLVQIYRDLPHIREMVAKKCTQVGWTELGLVFAAAQTGLRGRRHAVVMPDDDLAGTFVQDRIQKMIDRVALYAELLAAGNRRKAADNKRLIDFGHGSIRIVGSNKPAKLHEWMADSVLVDEVDECNSANLHLVRNRVRSSPNPQLFWLGNPKRGDRGIAAMYERTDQREWFHRCTHCGHRQQIDWFRNIVDRDEAGRWTVRDRERGQHLSHAIEDPTLAQDIRPVCVRCGRPWERQAEGCLWVRMQPDHARRGYHVSQMDHLGRRLWPLFLEWMAAQNNPDALLAFYSGVLGLAYVARGAQLTVQDLRACLNGWAMDYAGGSEYARESVVCGVDVGAVFNLTVSVLEKQHEDPSDPSSSEIVIRRAVFVGSVSTWDDIGDVFERYHVDVAVVDAEPEHHAAQEFRDYCNVNTRTRVYLCRYHPTPKLSALPYGLKVKPDAWEVQVDKTQIMDLTFGLIRTGRREYPANTELVLAWAEHMTCPVRKLVEKPSGERYEWDRGDKRDDYRQAECYEQIAADLLLWMGGYFEIDLT